MNNREIDNQEIVDCHYCEHGCTSSPDDKRIDCYADDWGYFSRHVKDSKTEAENCGDFIFCDSFPKF